MARRGKRARTAQAREPAEQRQLSFSSDQRRVYRFSRQPFMRSVDRNKRQCWQTSRCQTVKDAHKSRRPVAACGCSENRLSRAL